MFLDNVVCVVKDLQSVCYDGMCDSFVPYEFLRCLLSSFPLIKQALKILYPQTRNI